MLWSRMTHRGFNDFMVFICKWEWGGCIICVQQMCYIFMMCLSLWTFGYVGFKSIFIFMCCAASQTVLIWFYCLDYCVWIYSYFVTALLYLCQLDTFLLRASCQNSPEPSPKIKEKVKSNQGKIQRISRIYLAGGGFCAIRGHPTIIIYSILGQAQQSC